MTTLAYDIPAIARWVADHLPQQHPLCHSPSGCSAEIESGADSDCHWTQIAIAESLLLDALAGHNIHVSASAGSWKVSFPPMERFGWSVRTYKSELRLSALLAEVQSIVSKEQTHE